MDFRFYVYKLNKEFNALIFLKILLALSLLFLLFFTTITLQNTDSGFIFNVKNSIGMTSNFKFFDFNNFQTANIIILSFIIFSLFLYFVIFVISLKANNNIKKASSYSVYEMGKLAISMILDLIFIGFILIIIFRKEILIKVYNAGIDAWFDYSEEEY